jgi:tight adherence protein B
MNEPWIIYGLVFAAAILAVEGVYWLVFQTRGEKKAINRRLALRQSNAAQSQVLESLQRERGIADFKNPALARINDFLVQTGLRVSKPALILWTLAIGAALTGLASLIIAQRLVAPIVGFAMAPLLVAFYLRVARSRRIARFSAQLPDSIDVIVRGLRVGHPFSTAIDLVAREMQDPIGTEFGMTADELSFGQNIVAAVNNLYQRVGQEDLLFLVIAVSVQSQTGGNLAEVLARLSTIVRERATLRLKVKALTSEGRMSAIFLTAMPFALFAAIRLLAPHYFDAMQASGLVIPAVAYGLISILAANYAMYRMVNFKV